MNGGGIHGEGGSGEEVEGDGRWRGGLGCPVAVRAAARGARDEKEHSTAVGAAAPLIHFFVVFRLR